MLIKNMHCIFIKKNDVIHTAYTIQIIKGPPVAMLMKLSAIISSVFHWSGTAQKASSTVQYLNPRVNNASGDLLVQLETVLFSIHTRSNNFLPRFSKRKKGDYWHSLNMKGTGWNRKLAAPICICESASHMFFVYFSRSNKGDAESIRRQPDLPLALFTCKSNKRNAPLVCPHLWTHVLQSFP